MEERKKISSFRDLVVWQKAHQFVLNIYRTTDKFPKFELFGLTSQIRRAAMSIPANIVEGFKKKSKLDKVRFFNIAEGSLEETKYFLILAQDLNYLNYSNLYKDAEEIGKILNALKKSISSKLTS